MCIRDRYAYLERAIEDALAGSVVGLCTAPLNKESLQAAEVPFIDHTAVLKARAAHHDPMTLFMVRTLRIFFLTRHISFRQIPDAITREGLIEALPFCDLYLRQLGISEPTVAVAALNPHGGEQGLFGTDEMDVIGPATEEAINKGWRVCGPVSNAPTDVCRVKTTVKCMCRNVLVVAPTTTFKSMLQRKSGKRLSALKRLISRSGTRV